MVIWFLKTLHSKPVICLVYAFKETDGENHKRGKSQQNTTFPDSSLPHVTIQLTLFHEWHLKETGILHLVRHVLGTQ